MARNWDNLSAGYRQRLERSGVTRGQYESGASLEKARGHKETPEHPERAEANPQKYQKYLNERKNLVAKIQRAKRDMFSGSPKWNPKGSGRNIRVDAATGKVRSIQDLRAILAAATTARSKMNPWNYVLEEHEDYASAFFYH